MHLHIHQTLIRERHRIAAAAAALLATSGLALAGAASSHAAGSYINVSCTSGAGISDAYGGWSPAGGAGGSGVFSVDQCPGGGLHTEMNPTNGNVVGAYQGRGWAYDAPANTRVGGISASLGGWARASDGTSRGVVSVDFSQSGRAALLTSANSFWPTMLPLYVMGLNDTSISILTGCDGSSCSSNTAWFSLYAPSVVLTDDTPPTAGAISGAAKDDTTWKGTKNLAYAATDVGGGVAAFRLYVDGVQQTEHIIDSFGGHCTVLASAGGQWTFGYPKPCPAGVNDTEAINTTAIDDGPHTITAKVVDAGGREATLYTGTKLVANHPPVNTSAPTYENAANAAAPLIGMPVSVRNDGAWAGPSLTFVRGWQQCDASGVNCAQIPGAASLTYTPIAGDVGHKLRLAVTATNAADSVTVYSPLTGVVAAPSSADPATPKPTDGSNGDNGTGGAGGAGGTGSNAIDMIVTPGLTSTTTIDRLPHTLIGRVAGENQGVACPSDKATLKLQHIQGSQLKLAYGKAATAQLELTCTQTGKAIADAKLEIATKTANHAAVASDVTTDGAGHATVRLAKGPSRGVTVGYRMYADDPIARATATLKVLVNGKVSLKASHKSLHNGQAVTLRGALAGGQIPKRGVALAVQWKDGMRWRPFAQIKTDRKGVFKYAYKFTRTNKKIRYALRVQVTKGQVDYPYVPTSSKTVKVTVAP